MGLTSYEETVANLKEAYAILCGGSEHYVGLSAYSAFRCQCAVKDALELLQEQEAVEPHWRCSTVYMNGTGKIEMMCGNCGISIPLGKPNYCPWCGRAVKWDE